MKKIKNNFMKYFSKCLLLALSIFLIDSMLNEKNMMTSIVSERNMLEATIIKHAVQVGTYSSNDGHAITVNEDGTVLYDDTYSLTTTYYDNGNTITGKIGTNNKTVTFYQINATTFVLRDPINYTHNGSTVYLYDYTVFSLEGVTPTPSETGIFEVWSNNQKVNSYDDLQSAVTIASSGDTIKIAGNWTAESGVYINGKSLTIDGGNNSIDNASWSNGLFIVEENATLNLKNLTIDGGATGFEVDYDAVTYTNYTIPLKSGSDSADPKQNIPSIVSKGSLTVDKVNMNNNYTTTSGGTVRIISGTASFSNSVFNHNRASNGGAIFVGSNFKQNQSTYPVENLSITNCEFTKNYSSTGGAIYIYNTANVNIDDSDFISNTVNGGYGGAIIFNRQGSTAETKGLDFIQATIDNCTFEGNWAGNDGFAIQNYDAELTTTNSTFKKNVGVHPSSSVATYSMQVSRTEWQKKTLVIVCLKKIMVLSQGLVIMVDMYF